MRPINIIEILTLHLLTHLFLTPSNLLIQGWGRGGSNCDNSRDTRNLKNGYTKYETLVPCTWTLVHCMPIVFLFKSICLQITWVKLHFFYFYQQFFFQNRSEKLFIFRCKKQPKSGLNFAYLDLNIVEIYLYPKAL